jgi:hypothetical protein
MQRSVVIQDMKKGPFSPEEDAILLQRVAEWGDKGQGIWKALEQELGRPSNNIGNRYRKLLKSFHTGQPELPTTPGDPLAADDYLAVDSERKLAAALAPAVADTAAEAEGSLREAAVAAAAVLAGKKRGRPRINPLPLNMDGEFSVCSGCLLPLLTCYTPTSTDRLRGRLPQPGLCGPQRQAQQDGRAGRRLRGLLLRRLAARAERRRRCLLLLLLLCAAAACPGHAGQRLRRAGGGPDQDRPQQLLERGEGRAAGGGRVPVRQGLEQGLRARGRGRQQRQVLAALEQVPQARRHDLQDRPLDH